MQQCSGIPWAPLYPKSSPHLSLDTDEVSRLVSHWPTVFHPAECHRGCFHFSLCPGSFSCVLLCCAGYLSQEAVTAQLEFTLSFPLPYSLSKHVHLAFQPWKFSDPLCSFLKWKSQCLCRKTYILCNLNSTAICWMLSFVRPSRGWWYVWWNDTDTYETIWKQQSTVILSVLSLGAKMPGTNTH